MTLEQMEVHSKAVVKTIDAGRGLRRRLGQMGLHEGDVVEVSSRGAFRGPVLVCVHGMRVALGRGVARKIGVTPISGPTPNRRGSG